jgi:LacI family transcriptional regulator
MSYSCQANVTRVNYFFQKVMIEKEQQAPSRKSLTSADVARRAGVSRTTVSYVLNDNGKRSVHVSEATRAKVLQAAHELGYSIHNSAQALRRGQSEEICVIVDLPPTLHRTELVMSVQQRAHDYGYPAVVYFSYGFSPEQAHKLLLEIFARRPLGIFATASSMNAEHLALAKRMGVDNIVLNSVKPLEHPRTILLPTEAMGRLAAEHLLERGHRRLGLVRPANPLDEYGFQRRLEGMRSVLARSAGARVEVLPMGFSLPDAHAMVEQYLSSEDRPTGIYAYNDEHALLLLDALADRGIRVPQDIAILGTDDITFGEFMRPTLTTIRFDRFSVAERAVAMLASWYTGQPLPEAFNEPLVPQLVQRGST